MRMLLPNDFDDFAKKLTTLRGRNQLHLKSSKKKILGRPNPQFGISSSDSVGNVTGVIAQLQL